MSKNGCDVFSSLLYMYIIRRAHRINFYNYNMMSYTYYIHTQPTITISFLHSFPSRSRGQGVHALSNHVSRLFRIPLIRSSDVVIIVNQTHNTRY